MTFVALGIIATYVGLFGGYLASFPTAQPAQPKPPSGGVAVDFVAVTLEPNANVLTAEVVLTASPSLLDSADRLRAPIEVVISPSLGSAAIVIPAGTPVRTVTARLPLFGFVEQWPFDRYRVNALTVTACSSGCAGGTPLPVRSAASSDLPGWQIHADSSAGQLTSLEFTRSVPVLVFGFVVVLVLVLNAALALTVAHWTNRGRIPPQPALLGWYAALLFATVPLRSFFPGSPPIGSLVDYAIVLWVIVAISASLMVYLRSWFRVATGER